MLGVQKLDFVYYILYVVSGKVIIYKSRGEVSSRCRGPQTRVLDLRVFD